MDKASERSRAVNQCKYAANLPRTLLRHRAGSVLRFSTESSTGPRSHPASHCACCSTRTAADHLRAEGEDPTGWRVTLVTNLRVMGYVFNPASFYLCRDTQGALRVVVVEVHNTHLERHLYTLRPRAEGPRFVASMEKDFYVSPFIDMEGQYTVHVQDDPSRLRIAINERQGGEPLLSTSLVLERRRLTNRTVLRMLLRHPFSTQRTMALIHVHALRLWRRGIAFQRHGEAVARAQARRAPVAS